MVIARLAGSALIALLAFSLSAAGITREVAITFDDLPGNPPPQPHLLRSILAADVPAVGFVNENKLTPEGTAMLEAWLKAGLELGNHTYSHRSLHRIDVEAYEADILQGETVLRPLSKKYRRKLRYFRHPFLQTGRSLETRDRVHRFLATHGYTVAPVTLDNSEWIFAGAYQKTTDPEMRKRIGEAYLEYMDQKLAYFERQSQKLFGRNLRHVLLLHANALNTDWFDDLAASMRKRGYKFITLERALKDEAYRSEDRFTGAGGISWLHRWAMARGMKKDFFAGEPSTPQWVLDAAGVESE